MITFDPPRSSTAVVPDVSRAALTKFLERVQEAIGLAGEIDVLLADDATLRRLNRAYRGKNAATDVLSFPAATGDFAASGGRDELIAGDLAISLETAARQAAEHGHALRDEVRILIVHGALHLAGYDHEADSGEMAEREAELRRTLRLPAGLIARTEAPRPRSHASRPAKHGNTRAATVPKPTPRRAKP